MRRTDDPKGCSDLHTWFLRRRLPVIDLRSTAWHSARAEVLPTGYAPAVCLRRLATAGRVRRLQRGLYVVLDPVRETPPIAIASAVFRDIDHYVTTDAALAAHGLIDQPLPTITVVLSTGRRRSILLGASSIRPVTLRGENFARAQRYETTIDGFRVVLATRDQAVVDALAEPRWITHWSLLPEVLSAFDGDELEATARGALSRSGAAAQRLGYVLEGTDQPLPNALDVFTPNKEAVELRPGERRGPFSTRWRVYG